MNKNYELDVCLKEKGGKELFNESYQMQLAQEFVENTKPKEHGLKNHVEGFVVQLKNNCRSIVKQSFRKRQIYVVGFGMNTGSEINGDRPALIYKHPDYTLGDDVIVIPLTSAMQQKQSDKFDVLVPKDENNKLFQSSFARLRQLRSVSVTKIGKAIGSITNPETIKAINSGMEQMLAINA